jgi:hypothetical protein
VVGIVDFTTHAVKRLGGPKGSELKNPFAVFRSGDSLWVADWGLQRLTAWTLDGHLAGKVPTPATTLGALARARDAQGRFYVPMTPPAGPNGSGNRDSAAIVRVSADLSRIDTVARLAPLDVAEVLVTPAGDSSGVYSAAPISGEPCRMVPCGSPGCTTTG